MSHQEITRIEIVDDLGQLSTVEFIACTHLDRERLGEMVDVGLFDPTGMAEEHWQFAHRDVRRWRAAQRLIDDLGVNLAGAALILDLIEERDELLTRMTTLERILEA